MDEKKAHRKQYYLDNREKNVIEGGRAARNRTPQDYSVLAAAVKREKKTKSP